MMYLKPSRTVLPALALAAVLLTALAPTGRAQVCQDTQVYLTDNTRTNYSLGYEHFKNEAWCEALPYLRWVLANEPFFNSQGTPDDRNYRRLMDTYEAIAETAQGDVRRTYLDSVLVVRDQMQQALAANNIAYDERAQLLALGLFYTEHFNEYPDEQAQVYDLYMEAFRMEPDSTDDYYLNEIGRMISARAAAEQMDPTEARDLVNELLTYADDPSYLEGLSATFHVDPIDQWDSAYQVYLEGDHSEEVVNTVFAGLIQIDSLVAERYPDLDQQALKNEVIPILIEFNPTPDLLVYLGVNAVREGRTDEGIAYFQRALDMTEDNAGKRDLNYRIANTLFRAGQRSQAYQYAGRALDYDSNFGPALYVRALVVAGTLRGGSLANAAGAWCVADMFSRAAAAGGETAGEARRLAGRYNASGPSRDSYFFEGWTPGMRVTGNTGYGSCSTTVR
jgi:tetratricopeptide (TPR) repeat protein